jgi:hypothetical protein
MADLVAIRDEIERFLVNNEQDTIDEFIHWLRVRLQWNENPSATLHETFVDHRHDVSSIIDTSQIYNCSCGHRYSLRVSLAHQQAAVHDESSAFHLNVVDDRPDMKTHELASSTAPARIHSNVSSACKRFRTARDDQQSLSTRHKRIPSGHIYESSKHLICTQCQIRLHTHDTFYQHYSMHEQGYTFCKRCFQFYKASTNGLERSQHDCQQDRIDLSRHTSTTIDNDKQDPNIINDTKLDELHSLEQLIPPETVEQHNSNASGKSFDSMYEHNRSLIVAVNR